MGILNITPCDELADGGGGERAQVLRLAGDSKNLTTGGASARTTVPSGSNFVRLCSDTAVYIKFGDGTVEADVADLFLPANVVEYFILKDGETNVAAEDK